MIEEWYKGGILKKGDLKKLGGTMRLGSYECNLNEKSMARKYINQKKYMKDIDIDMRLILLTKTN